MGADEIDHLEWVVWNLEVRDPGQLSEPEVGERTRAAVTEMAGSLGCVFIQCCDDDTLHGVRYYSWSVRVPREEHLRRSEQSALPVVIAALSTYLRTQLPQGLSDWRIRADLDESLRTEAAHLLREAYTDLINPLEVALLGRRRSGAQTMEPQARYWWSDSDVLAGTYVMLLDKDPDDADAWPRWLLIYAGASMPETFWESPSAHGLRRFGIQPGSAVLLLPRPVQCQWLVTVTTGPFLNTPQAAHSQAVGASYRWTSRNGHDLARRVAADLQALFPVGDAN